MTPKFTENWVTGPGQRIFGVSIDGQTVLDKFDIYAESGGMWLALDKTFSVLHRQRRAHRDRLRGRLGAESEGRCHRDHGGGSTQPGNDAGAGGEQRGGGGAGAGDAGTVKTGNFTVSLGGGFKNPNGQPWTMRGLNAGVQDALQGFGNLLNDYPGLTAIRLNSGTDSASSIDQVVQEYTAKGIVLEIEDHSGNGDNVAWYQQLAQLYKDNPYVFLETPNEPSDPNTAQFQVQIINAIRAAGFQNPIGLQPIGGYDFSNISTVTGSVGSNQIFVTPHIYYNGSDPNGPASYVQSDIQAAQRLGTLSIHRRVRGSGGRLHQRSLRPRRHLFGHRRQSSGQCGGRLLGHGQWQPPGRCRLRFSHSGRQPVDGGRTGTSVLAPMKR